ncbi:MAG TPA: ATP-binding cassette domain-containing protein [Solirubrobacteraceae bacterium]|jgi:ABC-type methionine transport system ATPase subunit|nr:ATP-binding cassette domain-containing protein [Solirubrobacteraceae bacterium]
MSLLAFGQVSKSFPNGGGEIAVLDRVSFEVEVGETVGLLALRRGGKTTLLKIAAGLMAPDEGSVLWDDRELVEMTHSEASHARRYGGIALVRGEWRTSRSTSVLQHVSIPLYSGPSNMREAGDRVMRTLELVGAAHLGHRRTSELGSSERLVVELARAIIRQPRLLLVDEPAVFRNPEHARTFYELLHALPKKVGCALLIASEEPTALRGCKPMMSLSGGQLSSTASRRKVIDFPAVPGSGQSAS